MKNALTVFLERLLLIRSLSLSVTKNFVFWPSDESILLFNCGSETKKVSLISPEMPLIMASPLRNTHLVKKQSINKSIFAWPTLSG